MRTVEEDPSRSADQLLTDKILSGGWIASDCESEGGCDAQRNTTQSPPDVPFEPPVGDGSRNLEHEHGVPGRNESVPASEPSDVLRDDAGEPVAAAVGGDVNPAVPSPEMPKIEPHVNTEGHRKICATLLPVLFAVMVDPRYKDRGPREQVREACFRSMPLP